MSPTPPRQTLADAEAKADAKWRRALGQKAEHQGTGYTVAPPLERLHAHGVNGRGDVILHPDTGLALSAQLGAFLERLHHTVTTSGAVADTGAHVIGFGVGDGKTPVVGPMATRRLTGTAANDLRGWSVREETGTAPALLAFCDGDLEDQLMPVAFVNVPAGGSVTQGPSLNGVSLSMGLWLLVYSGTVSGAVWMGSS